MRSFLNIPIVYSSFPEDYINDINGWAFDEKTITECAGQLLTLDIDFGDKCSLNCPFCICKNSANYSSGKKLDYDHICKIILSAKELGLKSVKFLGAGEPLENKNIIEFIQFLKNLDIIPVVFSKTGIIGDDKAIKKHFSYLGIEDSEKLVEVLYNLNVSIIIGFNTTDKVNQNRMVGISDNNITYFQKKETNH